MSTTYPRHPGTRFVEVRPSTRPDLVWLVVAEAGDKGCHAGSLLSPAEAERISRALYSSAKQVVSEEASIAAVIEALPYSGAGRDEAEALLDHLADAGYRLVKVED